MTHQVCCLVPVKRLDQGKQRLSPYLTPPQRSALAQHMLEDVLDALAMVADLQTIVVTSDTVAARAATDRGLSVMPDEGTTQTAVIAAATDGVARRGAAGSLVVPGDVPLVTHVEIERILHAAPSCGSVLAPSRDRRGTNAVYRAPPALFALNFGDDSFGPHLVAARATGKPCQVLALSGLGLDIDRLDDLHQLTSRPGNTRTQRYLDELSLVHQPAQTHRV